MLTINGASDNIIQVRGDLYREFDVSVWDREDGQDYDGFLAFSDGTLLKIDYDDNGEWRFKLLYQGSLYSHKSVIDGIERIGKHGSSYTVPSDKVHFKDGINWVLFGKDMEGDKDNE